MKIKIFNHKICVCALQSHNGLHKLDMRNKANANIVRSAEMEKIMKIAKTQNGDSLDLALEGRRNTNAEIK